MASEKPLNFYIFGVPGQSWDHCDWDGFVWIELSRQSCDHVSIARHTWCWLQSEWKPGTHVYLFRLCCALHGLSESENSSCRSAQIQSLWYPKRWRGGGINALDLYSPVYTHDMSLQEPDWKLNSKDSGWKRSFSSWSGMTVAGVRPLLRKKKCILYLYLVGHQHWFPFI